VTCSLLPYIQSGIFGLAEVSDLLELFTPKQIDVAVRRDRPLIACVDDSMMVSHMMEQIVEIAGYRFLGINDPTKAASILLENKPDLIFLDVNYVSIKSLKRLQLFF
jgi:chemotaxis family two-component system response regulator PixG